MSSGWSQQHSSWNTPTITLPTGADANITLFIEPESKEDVVLNAITAAQQSIWIEMYEFTDINVANKLLTMKATNPNLDLRLLYEPKYFPAVLSPDGQTLPSWVQPNQAVRADGSPVSFHHAKFMLVDGSAAYIMTTNFTEAALGGADGIANREYIICDTNPQDIGILQAIFIADQQGKPLPSQAPSNLVVTDINAHATLRALLDSAQQSIYIQVESFADPNAGSQTAQRYSIEGGLLNAAQAPRTIQDIKIMLPPLPGATTTMITVDNSAAIKDLSVATSIAITTNAQYYMHAKLMLIDQRIAFIGSQNLTRESMSYNREVGIIISDAAIIQALHTTFMYDWLGSQQQPQPQQS